MNVVTRCYICGKEGEPKLHGGSGHPQSNAFYISPSWRPPDGWDIVLDTVLCADCVARVRNAIAHMAQNMAQPSGST